jgi:hypothetical protein
LVVVSSAHKAFKSNIKPDTLREDDVTIRSQCLVLSLVITILLIVTSAESYRKIFRDIEIEIDIDI